MTTEIRTRCKHCGGGLTFHDSRQADEVCWCHNDKPLEETAGHEAVPDPAATESVEVA